MKAKIAASLNYCCLGVAPMYVDPDNMRPELVEQSAADVPGEKLQFPRAYFSELRSDWKFMKDSRDMFCMVSVISITCNCRSC